MTTPSLDPRSLGDEEGVGWAVGWSWLGALWGARRVAPCRQSSISTVNAVNGRSGLPSGRMRPELKR